MWSLVGGVAFVAVDGDAVMVDEGIMERKLPCWRVIVSHDLTQQAEQNAKLCS